MRVRTPAVLQHLVGLLGCAVVPIVVSPAEQEDRLPFRLPASRLLDPTRITITVSEPLPAEHLLPELVLPPFTCRRRIQGNIQILHGGAVTVRCSCANEVLGTVRNYEILSGHAAAAVPGLDVIQVHYNYSNTTAIINGVDVGPGLVRGRRCAVWYVPLQRLARCRRRSVLRLV